MAENPKIPTLRFANSDEGEPNSYDEWTANPVVAAIKFTVTELLVGFRDK
jgi:hypothetical protein